MFSQEHKCNLANLKGEWLKERKREEGEYETEDHSRRPPYLIIWTRRCARSSKKRSSIWPMSAAFPWEQRRVKRALGCRQKVATTRFPTLVSNWCTSTFRSGESPNRRSFPSPSPSRNTSYVGGSGGKNANRAATDDVTFPIFTPRLYRRLRDRTFPPN